MIASVDDTEDLVQDSYIRAQEKVGSFRVFPEDLAIHFILLHLVIAFLI